MYYFHSFVVADISRENDFLKPKARGEILIFRYAGTFNSAIFVNRAYAHTWSALSKAPGRRRENTNRVRAARVNNGEFVKPPIHLRGTRACRSRR